ncbi:vitamin D3 hydroxylase-associated protein-like isoform X2 [Malaclemys terrapin pileata]|uniref:vitamin D3 hydroxylase-associated protein-like isoform X2 n=1 Tax=Malaclemys terrapin pileata TaxID=2991368 RepID=UPI0023A825BC|nr:vitamin D3 hydroxylase-associated protein-like isoform X2 [Malaclemys terrapin pileata]
MTLDTLRQLLPEVEVGPHLVSALLGSSAAAILVLKWMGQRRTQKKMEEARRRRELGLGQMEKAVQQFKQQNPGIQASHILSLSLVELAEKLKEGSLSPESVLYTYMDKALEVTREVNCLRHFIPECEEQLQEVRRQKEKGLLYGVPVSIKDHIGYKGHLSTCGFVQLLSRLEQEDSVMVKVLKRQGAIPFVLTNVPQSLFNYDCSNSIFGQTVNPLNHQKSPGGSSGGEGALIAGGGSVLGFGTDIGGSIRLPSSFCGLCGLKPTGNRLSLSGISGPIDGILSGAVGPMARDVDSLALCMRALLCDDMFRLDPTVPPLAFNEEVYSSSAPLRIGYYDTDGYFLLPPCMRRAVHETKESLQKAGHTLVPFAPPRPDYVMNELFVKGLFADGGSTLLGMFAGDVVDPGLEPQVNCYRIPTLVKKMLALTVRPLFPRLAGYLAALCGVRSKKLLWKQHAQVTAYRMEFIAAWRKLKLDVVLCPVLGPAFTVGYPGKLFAAVSSTMLYNVLNFPAGVVPVTTVTEADEEDLKHYTGHYGDPWDRTLRQAVEGAVGLPVAIQCVALAWQEELCLRFMKEVETLARGRKRRKV